MADVSTHFKPLDPGRINSDDALELAYWCKEFGCSESALQDALARVGNHVAEVRALALHE